MNNKLHTSLFDLSSIHQRYWKDFCDVCYSRFGFEQGEVRTYEQKYETFCRCKNYVTSEEGYEEQLLMTKEEDLQRLCDLLCMFYNLRDVVHMIPMLLGVDSMVKTLVESLNADTELIKRISPRNLSIDYRHYLELLQGKPEYRDDIVNDIRLKDFEDGWLKDIILKVDIPPYVDDCFKVSDATRKIARGILNEVIVSISELIDILPVEGVYPQGSELQAFIYHLFMSYECSLDEIKEEMVEYPYPHNLEYLKSEYESLICSFQQTNLGKHWCNCIEHKDGLQSIAKYFMHQRRRISEEDVNAFFYTLDKICIITDILQGKADKYWLGVDYPDGWIKKEEQITVEQLPEGRQQILKKLLRLVGKGDWIEPATENGIKNFVLNALGVGSITLTADDNTRVIAMWKLLETGSGDRVTVVFQNLIGYFVSRGWLQKGSPALNLKFFDTKDNYSNIDKGNPNSTGMSEGFRGVLPLLDKCAEALKS